MTLTPFQSLVLSVMFVIAAALLMPGCGLIEVERGYSPLWDARDHTGH